MYVNKPFFYNIIFLNEKIVNQIFMKITHFCSFSHQN